MDEQTVAARLRENIPRPAAPTPAAAPLVATDEQSSVVYDSANELALLKLGNELGVIHPDTDTSERLRFVYEQLLSNSANTSYDAVIATLQDYVTRLGLTFQPDRFMRLYLWMKLNQERQAIDQEMENVRG